MAKSSKILYVVTQSELGGAQRYVFDLAMSMKNKGYDVLIAAGGDGELFYQALNNNIAIHKLNHLVRAINASQDIKGYQEIKKLIEDFKPDIVHLNSSKAGILGSLASKRRVNKIIYTVHGFVFNEPMPGWKKYIYKIAEKTTGQFKHKLICVSEFDKQAGIKNKIARPNKFITIHNGITPPNFLDRQTARQELGLPQDKIVIGVVANFYTTKGLNYLIDASSIVINKNPNVIFRLVGAGNLEQDIKKQIKDLNLENNFILGKKSKASKYLKAFDIYVSSSVKEGFPYSILDAMSAGLAIVSTNVGGVPEAINETNGILVESKNSEKLADGIIKLIEDKNLANQLGEKARQDVLQNFSLEKMITKTEKIYTQ